MQYPSQEGAMSLEFVLGVVAGLAVAVVVIVVITAIARRRLRRALSAHPLDNEALLRAITAE
ncbi:MAG: hypothetical protein Q4C85_04950 [Actinomyces sp.]|uniref:hypothetical protein n=1 Tax=Actinomyces sp. TaxID=29317 RepID=UPI0026DAF9CC|nr:hypothetical protein [Actinomyces sp.]MDO4243099.1 hypothetical protein [Actinomyces sp.]